MKRIKIINSNNNVTLQQLIDKWIVDDDPIIQSTSIATHVLASTTYYTVSITYDDRRFLN